MICKKCGLDNVSSNKFCSNCGFSLSENEFNDEQIKDESIGSIKILDKKNFKKNIKIAIVIIIVLIVSNFIFINFNKTSDSSVNPINLITQIVQKEKNFKLIRYDSNVFSIPYVDIYTEDFDMSKSEYLEYAKYRYTYYPYPAKNENIGFIPGLKFSENMSLIYTSRFQDFLAFDSNEKMIALGGRLAYVDQIIKFLLDTDFENVEPFYYDYTSNDKYLIWEVENAYLVFNTIGQRNSDWKQQLVTTFSYIDKGSINFLNYSDNNNAKKFSVNLSNKLSEKIEIVESEGNQSAAFYSKYNYDKWIAENGKPEGGVEYIDPINGELFTLTLIESSRLNQNSKYKEVARFGEYSLIAEYPKNNQFYDDDTKSQDEYFNLAQNTEEILNSIKIE